MFSMKLKIFFLVFIVVLNPAYGEMTVRTIWGEVTVKDPVTEKFLKDPSLKRMKKIDQSGPIPYLGMMPFFDRASHCLGVWHLLKLFNCPLKEQLAGLLHDVSHTSFSHVADHLFKMPQEEISYQDKIHLHFLKTRCTQLLSSDEVVEAGILLKHLDPDSKGYTALEQPLPRLCADRIEYIIHTALLYGLITRKDVQNILKDLRFENGNWFFIHTRSARLLGELSLHFTENLWASKWNFILYHFFQKAVERAIKINLIEKEDFLYGVDEKIWRILETSRDPLISKLMNKCRNVHTSFYVTTGEKYDLLFKTKFRGVDPYVKVGDKLMLLTECAPEYKKRYLEIKNICEQTIRIVLTNY